MVSRRATGIGIVASAGILAVGWQFGVAHTQPDALVASPESGSAGTSSSSSSAAAGSGAATAPSSSAAGSAAATPSGGTAEYTGDSVPTRYGSVQVRITVTNKKITDVTALHLTDAEQRSVQISNYAAPVLRAEVLKAQSAKVQSVSGATYTSDAYLSSLQSALDRAAL